MGDDRIEDWRLEAFTTTLQDVPAAYPGGPSHKAGDRLVQLTATKNAKGELIGFETPSASALSLNIAITAAKKAEDIRPQTPYPTCPSPFGTAFIVPSGELHALFDYFEQCMISATFSYQAVETFCNESIGKKLAKPMKIRVRKAIEELHPEEIEQRLSTEEKLGKVLPKIFDVPTPSGKALWEKMLKLKRVRDSIIHLKSQDQYNKNGIDTETLFFRFLNHDPPEFPEAAISLISYFFDEAAKPRWLIMAPFLRRKGSEKGAG